MVITAHDVQTILELNNYTADLRTFFEQFLRTYHHKGAITSEHLKAEIRKTHTKQQQYQAEYKKKSSQDWKDLLERIATE